VASTLLALGPMQLRLRSLLFVLAAPILAGCAGPVASSKGEAPSSRELDRSAAIASARSDAAAQYGGDHWIVATHAHRRGSFWMVELHARNGSLVRYAISSHDGTIRERTVRQ
jgi:hypothetical protein